MILASHLLECDLPRLRGAGLEHGVQFRAGSLRAEEAAAVQRAAISGGLAHRFVELELVNRRQVIASIRNVGWNVVLGARIKIRFGASDGRSHPLISFAHGPPWCAVAFRFDLDGANFTAHMVC